MATITKRWYALAALALCTLAVGLDGTVLSVALPTLAGDLGASTGDLQWFTTSYLLVLAAALLPAGMLGDRFGRQGCCSAGWLLDHFHWGSVFLINLPLVVFGLIAVAAWVPESHGDRGRRFDPAGTALSAAGLVAVTYGIIEAGERGWGDPRTQVLIASGVLSLVVLVLWQRRAAAPLIDLGLFRNRAFTGGTLFATIAGFAFFGLLFALPQLFQAVGGQDAFGTGLRLLPVIGGLVAGARLAGALTGRLGTRVIIAAGLALMAAGLFAGAGTSSTSTSNPTSFSTEGYVPYWVTAFWITLAGIGVGFTMPSSMNAALGALTPERSGAGNGLIQALRQVGSAIGVAVLGMLLNSGYREAVDTTGLPAPMADAVRDSATSGAAVAGQLGDPALLASVRAAFVSGMDLALLVAGGVAAAGAVLALIVMPARGTETEPVVLAESGV
ncbi:MFS transporter [Actinoplanes sp. NPDC023936]|uniref:MFS transporter n=1 Tax=Actinoplanes sp. NPDC023936 TaxID=3154910 RepID=UPI0033DA27D9